MDETVISDKETISVKGYVGAMNGEELWVMTETDENMKIVVKDRDLRWKLYCTHVDVTIKQIDKSEL